MSTYLRGIKISLHDNEDLSNHIRREQDFFEAEILDYLKDYHKNQSTILDIGANIGNHSVYFANFLTYEFLLAIEPIVANYELLKQNMDPYDNIGLLQAAVSSTTGELRMVENHSNMGNSRIEVEGNISVNSISIDKLHFENVTLMKIDVEGHEPSVIEGAKDTIFRCHPLILIEDWNSEYAQLLPDYELEIGWPQHKTYLYKWRAND